MTPTSTNFDPLTVLQQLTWEEKIRLTAGSDIWRTNAIERLHVPYCKLTDGPSGARGGGDFNDATPSTLFPSPSCLGATWDVELAHSMGRWIGRDAHEKKCHVVLGPTINIQRDPRAGRFFESYSEDPHLTGLLGCAWVCGCQSTGVGATMKHFACNEAETQRRLSNSVVDETTLREIYLEPFRLIMSGCQKSGDRAFGGQPSCVMTAYNYVNGVSASQNTHLINDILRGEWGFKGCVMSDWFALHAPALEATDLEMPGLPVHRKVEDVLKTLAETKDKEEKRRLEQQIDRSALKVLQLVKGVESLGYSKRVEDEVEGSVPVDQVGPSIRQIAAEGAVLLKNDNNILPITSGKSEPRIACIGMPWIEPVQSGGGSANLTPQKVVKPLDTLKQALPNADIQHRVGCAVHNFPSTLTKTTMKCDFYSGRQIGQGRKVFSEEYEEANMKAQTPRPDVIPRNDFWVRATIKIQAPTDKPKTSLHFGIIALGAVDATVHADDREASKQHLVGETDLFEFILNPHRNWREVVVDVEAGQTVTVSCDYLPQVIEQADFADIRACGLQIGLDVADEKDEISLAAELARSSDVAIVLTALGKDWESEGYDREDMTLPRRQDELVQAVADAAPGKTIVLNITGCPINMPWRESVTSIVQAWYGGQEGAEAIVDILLGRGEAPASGKLAHSWPSKIEDHPSFSSFPGEGDPPQVLYKERTAIGYRHYDAKGNPAPLYHFGFGLGGYTTFELKWSAPPTKALVVDQQSSLPLHLHVHATNTGKRSGKEVAQVYRCEPKTLVGFAVLRAKPNTSTEATIELDQEAFSRWDEKDRRWHVRAGQYRFALARSSKSADWIDTVDVEVKQSWTWL